MPAQAEHRGREVSNLRDLPDAELVRLNSGHFAVEDNLETIAQGIASFYDSRVHSASSATH